MCISGLYYSVLDLDKTSNHLTVRYAAELTVSFGDQEEVETPKLLSGGENRAGVVN